MILWKEYGSRVGSFSCVEAREGVGTEGSPFPHVPRREDGRGRGAQGVLSWVLKCFPSDIPE